MIRFQDLCEHEKQLTYLFYTRVFKSGIRMDLTCTIQKDIFICKIPFDPLKNYDELVESLQDELKNKLKSFSHFEIKNKQIRAIGEQKTIEKILHPQSLIIYPNASNILAQKINEIIDYINK